MTVIKTETFMDHIRKSALLRVLLTVAFVGAYLISEPTLSSVYVLYFTYRAQTLVNLAQYALLAVVYGLTVFRIYTLLRTRSKREKQEKMEKQENQEKQEKQEKTDFGMLVPYVLIYVSYLVATLANPTTGDLGRWADTFFYSLIPLLLAWLFFTVPGGRQWYVSAVSWTYLILAALNIIFCFFPQLYIGDAVDWREEFFLGFENKAGWSLMLGAFFALMDWQVNGRRWKNLIYFILLLVNIRLVWCITALIGCAVLLMGLIPPIRRLVEKCDFLVPVGIIVVLFLCLMFFQKYTIASEPVGLFIEEVFKKKRNLSGRLPLWEQAVGIVLQKPWLGVGAQLKSGFVLRADEYGVWSWYHAHNEMLQTWYEGGLLMLVTAIGALVYAAGQFRASRNRRIAGLCKLVLFVFLFMQLSDNMPYYLWYMPCFIAHVSVMLCHSTEDHPADDPAVESIRQKRLAQQEGR